jgi:hypothetical protein
MLLEERQSCWGEYDCPSSVLHIMGHEAAIVGVFPDREFGTGGAPGVHDFCIRPASGADPFEKIEDQAVDRVGHLGGECTRTG